MIETIRNKITDAIGLTHLEIHDESHLHHGSGEHPTHLKIIIVSPSFQTLSSVKRHQCLYAILQEELASFLHALSLHTYAPEEWKKQNPISPKCLGGFNK